MKPELGYDKWTRKRRKDALARGWWKAVRAIDRHRATLRRLSRMENPPEHYELDTPGSSSSLRGAAPPWMWCWTDRPFAPSELEADDFVTPRNCFLEEGQSVGSVP